MSDHPIHPLDDEQLSAYLARIGYDGSRQATAATLRDLHRAHMMTVPFENLDIGIGRHIELSLDAFIDKIVDGGRGGFCFEHNGLFAAALTALGFDVAMLSARVHTPAGWSPPFDHMTLRVDLDERWLADVGFGSSFLEPLRMVPDIEQTDGSNRFKLTVDGDDWTMVSMTDDGWWESYRFTHEAHPLDAFVPRCEWLQTSPESIFVQRRICSRATPTGRITIADDKLIITDGEDKTETQFDEDRLPALLAEHFALAL